MLSRPREQEEVSGLVDEMLVLSLDGDPPGVAVEHRDGLAEVVDDRRAVVLVDDVPRRDERSGHVAEAVEVRRRAFDEDLDLRGPGQSVARKPLEVERDRLDHLRPVAGDGDPEPVDVKRAALGGH